MIYLMQYNWYSSSAKKLRDAYGKDMRKLNEQRAVKLKPEDWVVNWGCSKFQFDTENKQFRLLNHPHDVAIAADKLLTFSMLEVNNLHLYIPPYWTDKDKVDRNFPIVCRTKLNGHSGEGILLSAPGEELPDAPLYVRYIPKKWEFRVHATQYGAFLVRRKARDLENDNPNWMIRNHQNGFVYIEDISDIPAHIIEKISELATKAVQALDLDFGAVDIIWNDKYQRDFILEINTAPGLEGTSVDAYVQMIKGLVG